MFPARRVVATALSLLRRPRALTHLLIELARDGVDVDGEVLAQELADIRVLDVAPQRVGAWAAGAVHVDVDGRVPVRAPPDLRAHRDHLRERGLREVRARCHGCQLGV